jgi:hypothetical protein
MKVLSIVMVFLAIAGTSFAQKSDPWSPAGCAHGCQAEFEGCIRRSFGKGAQTDCRADAIRCRKDCDVLATAVDPSAVPVVLRWVRVLTLSALVAMSVAGSR